MPELPTVKWSIDDTLHPYNPRENRPFNMFFLYKEVHECKGWGHNPEFGFVEGEGYIKRGNNYE